MGIGDKIRSNDSFSAQVRLTHGEKDNYGTLCGGVASIGLKILILAYFCLRLHSVVSFEDPTLSSYTIMEDRTLSDESYNLADYS